MLWATQRLEEIRGFADSVTVLELGRVRFDGPVEELARRAETTCFVLRFAGNGDPGAAAAVAMFGLLEPGPDETHRLVLRPNAHLGDAIAALHAAGFAVGSCRPARGELEDAFLSLLGARG